MVVSSGKLAAPGGQITVVAVPGTSNVRTWRTRIIVKPRPAVTRR